MYILHHAARRLLQETASNSSSSSNSSQFDPTSFDVNNRFSPSMAIILVVLLSSFFFMAFFSVYVRRCSSDDEFNNAGAAPALRPPPEQGVDAAFLQSLPLVTYSAAKKKGSNVECVVCLTDFEENEPLRQLPKCKHVFHPECIDMWLFSHTTCPLCRRSLISDGSRSFRWGGSGSLRLSLAGNGSGRRSAAGPSTPTDIETGGHRNPGGVTTVINENLNGIDCSVHGRDQRLQALPRSHSTGHSLLKRALSRAIFRPSTENSLSNFIGGDSEVPPYGGGCVSITPPPLQRSRSVAAMEVEEAEVAPQPSNSSWMRGQGSWSLSLKRALSLNKLKLSPLQREALSAPVGHAAVSTSGRSTFERLTEV